MNGNPIRANLATTTVLLTLAAVMIGVANRGETAEQTLDEVCEGAVWPMIPAKCFGRLNGYDISAGEIDTTEMSFVVDQSSEPNAGGTSGKADLLRSTQVDDAQYRTVETRGNGVSLLWRIKVQ
jgi:hypothetical protein